MGKIPTSQLATARLYASAEDYAEAMSAYGLWKPTDPPHIRDRAEQEYERLKALWNLWKQLGLIGDY